MQKKGVLKTHSKGKITYILCLDFKILNYSPPPFWREVRRRAQGEEETTLNKIKTKEREKSKTNKPPKKGRDIKKNYNFRSLQFKAPGWAKYIFKGFP